MFRTLTAFLCICSLQGADEADPSIRPLRTDRPDTTESPYTVDPGHFQIEAELAAWSRDGQERALSLGELNLKASLDDSKDLQIVLPLYQHEHGGDEGFGNIELRLKWNLWGNDSGPTALALMPFIKLPTARGDLGNNRYEGGLIVPFAFDGPAGWSFGTQAEIDLQGAEDGQGYQPAFLASFTSSHDLTDKTAAFFELVGILSTDPVRDFEAYFNTGLTWSPEKSWQLDGGIRTGLTAASIDFTPFIGTSKKF